jgi:tRNA(Ile2) C34 agmatinyltransferase TiaS
VIRVLFAALILASVIGWALGMGNGGVMAVFIVLFIVIAVANVGKLRCPYCGKRVKLGAGACHHCGREVKAFVERR